jgi:hypothetical protein
MKIDDEIQDQIRKLLDEEFRQRVDASQERLPCCCVYNYRHSLDSRKRVNGEENTAYNRITRGDNRAGLPVVQSIGLCMYGSEDPQTWPGTICEDPVDAMRCPPQAFTPKVTPEVVQADFEAQIKDPAWVKRNLPEVNALLWVLGTEKVAEPPPAEPETDGLIEIVEKPIPPMPLSWWARLVLWLAGISRHQLLPPGGK